MQEDIILRRTKEGVFTNVVHTWVYHSPDGFEWGYGGSGPSDLALNILLMFTDKKTAWALHQDFKWKFIADMPEKGGVITVEQIKKFLAFDAKYPKEEKHDYLKGIGPFI